MSGADIASIDATRRRKHSKEISGGVSRQSNLLRDQDVDDKDFYNNHILRSLERFA